MLQFDDIAARYSALNTKLPIKKYGAFPSFFTMLGDVRGKRVLDAGTGNGIVAEAMAEAGALRVEALDNSRTILDIARSGSAKNGVAYHYGDMCDIALANRFDIVTAVGLLDMNEKRDRLMQMCANIGEHLEPGGMLYGLISNPFSPLSSLPKYVRTVKADEPLREGDKLYVDYTIDNARVSYHMFHWNWSTYEAAMNAARLDLEMVKIHPTQEGLDLFGKDFWHEFIMHPHFTLIRAKKR